MNKDRRKAISDLMERVSDLEMQAQQLAQDIEAVHDEEQEYFDNMPESLQGGEKGQAAQEAIDHLDNAAQSLNGFDFSEISTALESAAA